MSDRVILLDIDLTLLATGGAGMRSLEYMLDELFGDPRAGEGVSLAGRTDPEIFGEIMDRLDLADRDRDEAEHRARERYLELLERELAGAPGFRLCPGLPEVLDALVERGVLLGLCTGNLERGARLKLARGNIDRYFEFGGFGEDGPDRADVARAAVRRAGRRLGERADPDSTWIVGDTPRDVSAAHAAGVRALAVATGHHDAAALQACGADRVLADLAVPGWIDEIFPIAG